eukprot:scaffold63440_cov63-Phaeocystis_antarctica.AAC.4
MPAKPMTRKPEPGTQVRVTWVACRSCRAGTIALHGCLVSSVERQAACAQLSAQAAEAQAASRAS